MYVTLKEVNSPPIPRDSVVVVVVVAGEPVVVVPASFFCVAQPTMQKQKRRQAANITQQDTGFLIFFVLIFYLQSLNTTTATQDQRPLESPLSVNRKSLYRYYRLLFARLSIIYICLHKKTPLVFQNKNHPFGQFRTGGVFYIDFIFSRWSRMARKVASLIACSTRQASAAAVS